MSTSSEALSAPPSYEQPGAAPRGSHKITKPKVQKTTEQISRSRTRRRVAGATLSTLAAVCSVYLGVVRPNEKAAAAKDLSAVEHTLQLSGGFNLPGHKDITLFHEGKGYGALAADPKYHKFASFVVRNYKSPYTDAQNPNDSPSLVPAAKFDMVMRVTDPKSPIYDHEAISREYPIETPIHNVSQYEEYIAQLAKQGFASPATNQTRPNS